MKTEILYIDMPDGFRGAVTPDFTPGCYTIFINSRLPERERSEALRHEMSHITRGDFERGGRVGAIEKENEAELLKAGKGAF